jgi:hypothetical protein
MYTRIMMSLYQPGKMDEALQIYRESILPTLSQQPGLKGVIVLLGHHSGMAMSITLWETEANLQAQLAKVVPFLTWAPVIETFEVGIWEIKLGTTVQFERVMTFHLQPETTGEFV